MMNKVLLIIVIGLILGCSQNQSKPIQNELLPAHIIDLQNSIQAFTIDYPVKYHKGHCFILDRIQNKVIKADESISKVLFEFDLETKKTDDLDVYSFDIIKNHLFLRGSRGFHVFELTNNQYVGFYKNKFPLAQQLLEHEGILYTSMVTNSEVNIVSFDWNVDHGFFDVKTIVAIPSQRNTMEVDLSGWLISLQGEIVYIDEWSGEFFVVNLKRNSIVRQGRLPFGGPISENYELDNAGKYFGTYKNAYSISQKDKNSFFVLRELDWENSESVEIDLDNEEDKQRIRKLVHLVDDNFQILNSYLLSNHANCIFYQNGKLYANHTGDEKLYIYKIE